jgi:hypothetical protein
VRPTILYLAGIVDDYVFDGRVITELLRHDGGLNRTQELGDCYKQLNASVGTFGSDTLVAATKALATGSSSDDAAYISTDAALSTLGSQRDTLATSIKNLLDQAEFHGAHPDAHTVSAQLQSCTNLLHQAAGLAAA